MKPIKRKTYYNFMRVVRLVESKGYTFDEAKTISHHIFDEYNPNGLPILAMIERIIPKAEHETAY